jgi:general secretion pathway protein I
MRGFSLLEAIVALALIATSGIAIYSWINSSLISIYRAQENTKTQLAVGNSLEYLQTINPAEKESGTFNIANTVMTWQATPISKIEDGAGYPGGQSLYEIGLYELHVSLTQNGQPLTEFKVNQVGYKQIRVWTPPF